MKILVVDNYDSFVFNLVHILYRLDVEEVDVIKNDKIDSQQLDSYEKIILSPGPGIPCEAGNLMEVIKCCRAHKDILGVCLGHQAIAESFGGSIINLEAPLHGVSSQVRIIHQDLLFKGIPESFKAGHYHSWVVSKLPEDMEILAIDENQNIMAIRHQKYNVRGVQFHPESILSDYGVTIISNWLNNPL